MILMKSFPTKNLCYRKLRHQVFYNSIDKIKKSTIIEHFVTSILKKIFYKDNIYINKG